MVPPPTPTPAAYPVNDTSLSAGERAYLRQLTAIAATQDLTQDDRVYIRNVTVGFTVSATVFVVLRFVSRYRQAARAGADDWLILAAFLVLIGNMVDNLLLVQHGVGLHSGALTWPEMQSQTDVSPGTCSIGRLRAVAMVNEMPC